MQWHDDEGMLLLDMVVRNNCKAVEDVVAVKTKVVMHGKQNDTSSRGCEDKGEKG